MHAAEVLNQLQCMGISLAPLPGGKIEAKPKRALTDEVRRMIRSHKPEAFLTLGDNVYMDLPAKPNGFVEYTYYRRQSRPEFRRLVSSVPVYAIWDDHDSGMDDDWLGPYKDKPDWKLPLFRNFQQQWNNPAYGDPESRRPASTTT